MWIVIVAAWASPLQPAEMTSALDDLVETLHGVHPEPFAVVPAKAQAKLLKRAKKVVNKPMETARFANVARTLVTPLGDAHTNLNYSGDDSHLDARFEWAHDGLAMVEGPRTGRVLTLNGRSVDDLLAAMDTLVSSENLHWVRARGERLLTASSTWEALGHEGPVTIGFADGEAVTLGFDAAAARQKTSDEPPTWWTVVPEAKLGWLRLSSCPSPTERWRTDVALLFGELDAHGLDTLVIDVRGNGGGNSSILDAVLDHLPPDELASYGGFRRWSDAAYAQRDVKPGSRELVPGTDRGTTMTGVHTKTRRYRQRSPFTGEILVLVDEGTFSSGNWVAVMLADNGLAQIVGEPTGNAPSSYGDLLRFPSIGGIDGVDLSLSYTRWLRPDVSRDPANTLVPDHLVPVGVDDHLLGRDPVWAWLQERQGVSGLDAPSPPTGMSPVVARLDPPSGSASVDPSRTTLTVTFSEPMKPGGRALIGGGATFPEVGETRWLSPTTFEIDVTLKPGQAYRIGVNSQRYQGFAGEDGTPSKPAVWTFQTAD